MAIDRWWERAQQWMNLRVKLQFGGYHHLVEADIKGFFDNLSHEWLMRMLAERIDDEPLLRLIKKWLKALECWTQMEKC